MINQVDSKEESNQHFVSCYTIDIKDQHLKQELQGVNLNRN